MRLSLVSATFLATCLASSAFAADLPPRAAPAPVIYAPIFTWTGFYVGLNAGVGWADSGDVIVTGPTPGSSGILGGGGGDGAFVGGGQIGYNWQSGSIVYGLETDIQYVGTNSNVSWGGYSWWAGRGGGDGSYFGTVRARLGYAVDRTLFYVTGGLAYGGLNTNPLTGDATSNAGWTVGGGVEYAFTNNWTVKIEGLYVDTGEGRKSRAFVNAPGGVLPAGTYTATSDGSGGGGLLRVGVNYKF
ncbi:outer membrane protein [Bosea sp. NBC_00550]|uniref:outer membrane protein n=1 Tax=Bosea sp. NBC_00550 TaxID=2969621 RepID=UPI0022310424|nr:outer membrane beta-barrel protein [Bosea sp. NBC_00550]UZF93135.1 outer membrane beta-barrel protein [Bosea sp. NBC_00550]